MSSCDKSQTTKKTKRKTKATAKKKKMMTTQTMATRSERGLPIAKPYDARLMRCYPVSTRINHVANDDEACFALQSPLGRKDSLQRSREPNGPAFMPLKIAWEALRVNSIVERALRGRFPLMASLAMP